MNKLKNKNITVITSSRADYGLFSKLLIAIQSLNKFNLNLLVTGSHLDKKTGLTFKEIVNEKIKIQKKIPINQKFYDNDSKEFSIFLNSIGSAIKKTKPDLVIILGDRKEILATAIATFLNNYKLAHISGGEKTLGSIDDVYRQIISKLSDFHFVSEKKYKNRLIQLGEEKNRIFITGSLATDNINSIEFLSKKEIQKKYNFSFYQKNFLITFHPDTSTDHYSAKDFNNLLKVLQKYKHIFMIFTYPNSDKGNNLIIKKMKEFNKKNKNSIIIKSLGQKDYLSILKNVDIVVGNSSSGITEAPIFKKLSLNIGKRQEGRLMSSTVENSETNYLSIKKKLDGLILKKQYGTKNNIYFRKKNAVSNILKLVNKILITKKKIKIFQDIKI